VDVQLPKEKFDVVREKYDVVREKCPKVQISRKDYKDVMQLFIIAPPFLGIDPIIPQTEEEPQVPPVQSQQVVHPQRVVALDLCRLLNTLKRVVLSLV
jgi:hypothetical protein